MLVLGVQSRGRGRVLIALAFGSLTVLACGGRTSGAGLFLPAALDFGGAAPGQTVEQRFSVANVGAAPLTVEGLNITGANGSDFSVSRFPVGVVLAPLQEAFGDVQFRPSALGSRRATLQVATDARPDPDILISLTGTGLDVQICPQPASLDFGDVRLSDGPAARQLDFLSCGTAPATLTVGPLGGPDVSDFAVSGTTQSTLSPGEVLSLSVSFVPSRPGLASAAIPWSPCPGCPGASAVSLSGNGLEGILTLSPRPLTFSQPGTQVLTATNTGNLSLKIESLSLQTQQVFSVVSAPALPVTLGPQQSASWTVAFAGSGGAPASDQVSVTWMVLSSSPANPVQVATDAVKSP